VNTRIVAIAALGWCVIARGEPSATVSVESPEAASVEPAAAASQRKSQPVDVPVEELDAAIARGRAFLVGVQNADGSFGSAGRTKDLNIMAGVGSHLGFRAATTALAVQALIEEDDGTPGVAAAIDRGERWLFERLPDVRRDDPTMIYNVWAHAYGIQALVAMHGRKPDDAARRQQIVELIHGQFARLVKYESAQGGWGYYDFNVGSQRPASSSTSFVNAVVLIAFDDAKRVGIEPPEKVTRRAIEATEEQMLPDFSYLSVPTFGGSPGGP